MITRERIGLFSGIFLLLLFLVLPTPEGLQPVAMRAAGVALLMTLWWITEAIPIAATALVPLALFPLLGVLDIEKVAENYGHHFVLMLLGGLFIAKAIELHNLHRRIALVTIKLIGTSRQKLILGFMISTAFLSMWIANVAVTLLMLPIAMAVVTRESKLNPQDKNNKFGLAMMLAVAYAASIGGTGTLIGTPPNMVFAGMFKSLYPGAPDIGFFQWMQIGIPLVLILLPTTWFYLLKFFNIKGSFPEAKEVIDAELSALGRMTTAEKRVLIIFVFTALGWIFRKDLIFDQFTVPGWASLLGIQDYVHDATVAIFSSLLMFMIPTGKIVRHGKVSDISESIQQGEVNKSGHVYLLNWRAAESVPWGVVFLVAGGYAIAQSFTHTGLAAWLGNQLGFVSAFPLFLVLLSIVLFMTFATEINSNTATANIFLPILAAMAVAGKAHPLLLMIPGTIACSCAFMLPSGTGTNAIVFSSGKVTIPEMATCGFWLNFISIAIVTLILYLVAIPLLGISSGVPLWAE